MRISLDQAVEWKSFDAFELCDNLLLIRLERFVESDHNWTLLSAETFSQMKRLASLLIFACAATIIDAGLESSMTLNHPGKRTQIIKCRVVQRFSGRPEGHLNKLSV